MCVCAFSLSMYYASSLDTSTLSLHDALPISARDIHGSQDPRHQLGPPRGARSAFHPRCGRGQHHPRAVAARGGSEEHTTELQSPCNLVCCLLLEKKKK